MDFLKLNPVIRSVSLYERISRSEECRAYDCRVFYLCSGDLGYTVNGGKKQHLTPGSLLYVPAGVPYALSSKYARIVAVAFDLTCDAPEPLENFSAVASKDFDESRLHDVSMLAPFDTPIFIPDLEAERDTFLRMTNIFVSGEGNFRAELSAMFKLILLKAAEIADTDALPARMVENLDSYIRDNAGEEISNTELGAIFGYHPFYISKMLKDKKGITLHQYVISYRMKAAKEYLRCTDKTVNEIAEATGFSDPSYFTKCFRAQCGVTPKEYRNRFKDEFI